MQKTKIILWLLGPMLFVLGFFVFGNTSYAAGTYFRCSCEIEKAQVELPSLPQGGSYQDEDGDSYIIENATDAEIAYLSKNTACKENTLHCVAEDYLQADSCNPEGISSECPPGYKCKFSTSGPFGESKYACLPVVDCKVDSDCTQNEVCNKQTGYCVVGTSTETQECVCAQGKISCVSPMCSTAKDSLNTGICEANRCQKKGSQTASIGCSRDTECWDKGIAACCVSGQCTGPISQCKNNSCSSAGATDGTNTCPPGYLCDTDFEVCRLKKCPIQAHDSCNTDADCTAQNNGKCTEITKDSFATDDDENILVCKNEGTTKQCVYGDTTKVNQGPTSVDFSWWPAKGRLQSLIGAKIIPWIMGMVGLLCVVIIIIGGFLYLLSGGNEQKIEAAKKMITAAVIGLFFTLVAYIAVEMVIGIFTQ